MTYIQILCNDEFFFVFFLKNKSSIITFTLFVYSVLLHVGFQTDLHRSSGWALVSYDHVPRFTAIVITGKNNALNELFNYEVEEKAGE